MAESNKGAIAAVFAAGLAAGGAGGEIIRDPDPTSYMAAGIVEAITNECMDQPCRDLRNYQWGLILDDLRPDVKPGEEFQLGNLSLYVAERLDYADDSGKEIWLQDAVDKINERLADGYASGEISPDDTLSGDALLAMMEAARA